MLELNDLMSCDVKVIGPKMSIGEAAVQMRDGDFGMLPADEDDGGWALELQAYYFVRAVAASLPGPGWLAVGSERAN